MELWSHYSLFNQNFHPKCIYESNFQRNLNISFMKLEKVKNLMHLFSKKSNSFKRSHAFHLLWVKTIIFIYFIAQHIEHWKFFLRKEKKKEEKRNQKKRKKILTSKPSNVSFVFCKHFEKSFIFTNFNLLRSTTKICGCNCNHFTIHNANCLINFGTEHTERKCKRCNERQKENDNIKWKAHGT